MAKITITGRAVVITSAMKLNDLKTIKKYRPNALTLYEGEGEGKEPVFAIGVGQGFGNIGKYGAEFGHTNSDGYAQITMCCDVDTSGDIKEYVAENVGCAILQLNKLEEMLPDVIREIEAEKASIMDNITVAE